MIRILQSRKSKTWLTLAVAVVVLLGGAGVVAWRATAEQRRGVEDTVAEFFAAQRNGDCARLTELVTTGSWSNDGKLSSAEFVRLCRAATKGTTVGYRDLQVTSRTEERAVVTMEVRFPRRTGDGTTWFDDRSTLRREDGVWKLSTDGLLRIGRPYQEAMYDYLQASNAGNCQRMADLVDAAPATFLTSCEAGRSHRHSVDLNPASSKLTGKDRIDATVFTTPDDEEGVTGAFTEEISLVYRDLQWKLVLPSVLGGRLAMAAALQLGDHVIAADSVSRLRPADDPNDGPKQALRNFTGMVADLPEAELERRSVLYGYQKTYLGVDGGQVQIDLVAFADDKAAAGFAGWMVDYYLGKHGGKTAGEAQDVGVPNARGWIGYLGSDHVNLFDSTLVATRGNLMIRVSASRFGESAGHMPYDYARNVLKAQLDRL